MDFLEQINEERKKGVIHFFDALADTYDSWCARNRYYYQEIEAFCANGVPPGSRVLEIGCATGNLLNSVSRSGGVGIDISPRMIAIASKKYPHLNWEVSDIEHLKAGEPYDIILMSNLLEFIPDLWSFFSHVKRHTHSNTQLIILTTNPLWEPLMWLGAKLRLRCPELIRNYVTREDLTNVLALAGYPISSQGYRFFFPKKIPFVSFWVNRLIPRIAFVNKLCALQYVVLKPEAFERSSRVLSCSVIIPCYNEAGNIEECVQRIPKMGTFTEVVVVDDGSSDGTYEKAKSLSDKEKEITAISYTPNQGKGYAVRRGIQAARGDVILILDADMTVMPEELPRFFQPLSEGRAGLVSGTRMVYPMESGAMKFLSFIGNKVFGLLLGFVMEQRKTDTGCGTNAFFKKDFHDFTRSNDVWGDCDLLLEAARKRLKILELPVHYRARQKGSSKMHPFQHGLTILRTFFQGLKRLA